VTDEKPLRRPASEMQRPETVGSILRRVAPKVVDQAKRPTPAKTGELRP
jgi:hypothetical protein